MKWLALLLAIFVYSIAGTAIGGETNGIVQIEGRVRTEGKTNLTFQTSEGKNYKLLRTTKAEALFLDTNLHSKILLLKGRFTPDKKGFETTGKLQSIRDGQVNDLYYYCEVCSISSSVPGLCQCCREPVELREEPADSH